MSSKPLPIPPDARAARWITRLTGLALAAVFAGVPPASADEAAFDRAVRQLAGHCARTPAPLCAERAFDLVDADDDGVAGNDELAGLDARLRLWDNEHAEALHPLDRRALQLGFLLVDTIGIERGMLLYDEDGDGALSLEEMTADLVLDDRPLPEIVQAREIVDWPSLRRRFGATAMIFDYLDIR